MGGLLPVAVPISSTNEPLPANMGLVFNLSEQTSQLEARKRVNGPNLSLSNQSSLGEGGVYGITRVRLASSAWREVREREGVPLCSGRLSQDGQVFPMNTDHKPGLQSQQLLSCRHFNAFNTVPMCMC